MFTVEKHLLKHKCKSCGNLTYWDWYICKIRKHMTRKGFLHMGELKYCEGYIKREGKNWDSCRGQECIFWCLECPAYEKKGGT